MSLSGTRRATILVADSGRKLRRGNQDGCSTWKLCWFCLVFLLSFLPLIEAATIELGSNTVSSGVQIDVTMTADVGDVPLGRYEVAITYDTNLVQFTKFTLVNTNFPTPELNVNFPGEVRVCANNKGSMTAPTGVVQVARITFQVVGIAGRSSSLSFQRAELLRTSNVRAIPTLAKDGIISISASGGTPP